MGKVAVALGVGIDVSVREHIELLLTAGTCGVHREQNWPSDQAADEGDDGDNS